MSDATPGSRPQTTEPGVRVSWGKALGALLPAALLLALLLFDLPICPSRTVFGVPCPGCGLTRATRELIELDVAGAFAMHPLVFLLLPLVVWMILRALLAALRVVPAASRDPLDRMPAWFWWSAIALVVGVWAVRLATGTHPDPFDPEHALLGRAVRFVLGGGG